MNQRDESRVSLIYFFGVFGGAVFGRCSTTLQPVPVRLKFSLMMSCPSYHESFFPTRQRTGDPRDWRDAVYAFLTLMVRMKVSEMVALANLHEHPDNDTAGWHSQASATRARLWYRRCGNLAS